MRASPTLYTAAMRGLQGFSRCARGDGRRPAARSPPRSALMFDRPQHASKPPQRRARNHAASAQSRGERSNARQRPPTAGTTGVEDTGLGGAGGPSANGGDAASDEAEDVVDAEVVDEGR